MGYDLTLLAGTVHEKLPREDRCRFSVKSTFDYRLGYKAAIMGLKPEDPVAVYFWPPATRGKEQVTKDKYGTECVAVEDKAVLAALKKDARTSDYLNAAWLWAEAIAKGAAPDEVRFVLWGH